MTDIGSRRWWQITPLYGAMGIADHVLRLLEQEVISRRKASELLAWGEHVRLHADGCPPHCERLNEPPGAPWGELNWCDDVDDAPTLVAVASPVLSPTAEQGEPAPEGTAIVCYWSDAHDGPGWYYHDEDYDDEGSCGAFATAHEAIEHARESYRTIICYQGGDAPAAEPDGSIVVQLDTPQLWR